MPPWKEKEIILGLDIYWRLRYEQLKEDTPEIIELSRTLRSLNLHKWQSDSFRNASGVADVLRDYRKIEEDTYQNYKRGPSKLAIELYHNYDDRREELHQKAEKIRRQVSPVQSEPKLYHEEEDEGYTKVVREGSEKLITIRSKERDRNIVRKKKAQVQRETGRLACEGCDLDFAETYGADIGDGFIECHHIAPLADAAEEIETSLDDLTLLCPNCHRMIHKVMEQTDRDPLLELRRRLKGI